MATINVLLYTDSFDIASDSDGKGHGTSRLKALLQTKTLAFADFEVTVINRNAPLNGTPPPQRLTKNLLLPFDEFWLFGWYQIRVEQDFDPDFGGGRDNELDENEAAALEEWMNSGGILISGDHSEPPPKKPTTDPIETFLCLGRALGHKVKRAGELRQWKGPFTNQPGSSFNTLVRTAEHDELFDDLQIDCLPQSISLLSFAPDGSPHPIFRGTTQTIRILPDHKHEGQLILPDLSEWPPASTPIPHKPKPRFVAMGCDKRSCESHPLLAVYNGDEAGVGRIIADSSWHHYLNKNLAGLDIPTLDLLKQLFHNIAFYLAPLSKRQEMAREMFKFLVRHPDVQEERGNSPYEVGRVALQILSANSTQCEIDELLRIALPPDAEVSNENLSSPEWVRSFPPTQDLVLGAIINRFFQTAFERLAAAEAGAIPPHLTEEDIISAGLEDALKVHIESLKGTLSKSPRLLARLVNEWSFTSTD